jgi:GntR family transcriptional regulator
MRKALDVLAKEHVMTRRQGRGTFVNNQSSKAFFLRYENVRGPDGERLTGEEKSFKITQSAANEMECERLSLPEGDKVYRIQRVRLTGGKPLMLEEVSVPEALFPGWRRGLRSPTALATLPDLRHPVGAAAERICGFGCRKSPKF